MSTDTATKLPEIFARCCADHKGHKHDMTRPWVHNDYFYATDGRILVRMPFSEGIDTTGFVDPKATLKADAADFFFRDYQDEGIPCPSLDGKGTDCQRCKGTGTAEGIFCDDCGAFMARSGVWSKCEDCCGCGKQLGDDDGLDIGGGCMLSFQFLRILDDFHATLYLSAGGKIATDPVRFTTPDGVEGMVMPLDKSKAPKGLK